MNYIDIRYEKNCKSSYDYKLADYLSKYFFKLHENSSSLKIAEIGAGTGKLCSIWDSNNLLNVTAYDIEKSARFPSNIPFFKSSISDIINSNNHNCYDIVFSKSVIEHIHDPSEYFKALDNILDPSGYGFIMCPNWSTQYINFYDDPTHCSPFNKIGLETLARMNNYKVINCKEFYQIPYFWKHEILAKIFEITRFRMPLFLRKRFKYLRFSYENMLLLITQKNV